MLRLVRYSILGLVVALSLSITGVTYAEGSWSLTDNGYKIWSPCQQIETVRWSGSFDNNNYAAGKGTIQWLEEGALVMSYEGDVVKGMANGFGIVSWPDGERYEGNFINGKMHGYGTYYHSDGSVERGQWNDGEFIG